MTKTPTVIGLDLGGTKLAAALFSTDGKVLQRTATPLQGRSGRDVGKLITTTCTQLVQTARQRGCRLMAAGACVPGIAWHKSGRVWAPNIPGWDKYPLRSEMQRALGPSIRVNIESDRACYILGERWRGAARRCSHAIFIAVGTGIGAGILVDGRILRGARDISGAIGWWGLDRPFRQEYVTWGCFEHHASGNGLARVARELLAQRPDYRGALRERPEFTARDIFELHPGGDPIAVRTIEIAVEFWGMAVANLVSVFNPEKIIFGGGVFGPAAAFLPRIVAEAERWAQPISIRQVQVVASKLGSDAGLFGAGYLALTSVTSASDSRKATPRHRSNAR